MVASPQETLALGRDFADKLVPGDVVLFKGELGAGKTTCIKGVCAGLGVRQAVTSPSFTLINEYRGRIPVYHFDFYRLQSEHEAIDLGLQDYFDGDGVCLIEWPDVMANLLPPRRYEFHLKWDPDLPPDARHIVVYAKEESCWS
ncbi:tRNA (adenosine(37)-N6)-threonylcarbamoyltransferase complex ATPase subunit type 1 TsaE [candidate division KSB1 bacterium]|nr:tRNA (adenosine(37)-N6)-threonylcarbamoyltransferase complex ATPase subunit type 1 TsaE [candidate division KSB1 bacterium]RQW11462.1 MAG: tRNA (adenosine(37)-N6)-threonylcarbamoyltransferase complex ATPase subunit type 1 TsaE [candidate division KSB1 bacterium]